MEEPRSDIIIKIVIMGEASVGKTNLLTRYIWDRFDDCQKPTIGMDFLSKDLVVDNCNIKVQFWDTAGQEKYRSLASSYYKIANGAILVYDVTNKDSFDRINRWLEEIRNNTSKDIKIMLIGNKNDLMDSREVSLEEGKALAEENNIFFWETSAKVNIDLVVHQAFTAMIEDCTHDFLQNEKKRLSVEYSSFKTGLLEIKNQQDLQKHKSCC